MATDKMEMSMSVAVLACIGHWKEWAESRRFLQRKAKTVAGCSPRQDIKSVCCHEYLYFDGYIARADNAITVIIKKL